MNDLERCALVGGRRREREKRWMVVAEDEMCNPQPSAVKLE